MFEIRMIAGPVIGAVIGYCTNYIAVQLMFRPMHPVKIGKFTLPFTPGIIPKGKERLAKAIGAAVGKQLLTKETMEGVLLSDSIKEKVGDALEGIFEVQSENEMKLGQISDEIGSSVAGEVIKGILESVQGSFLAMMVNEKMLENFREPIAKKVNEVTIGRMVTMVKESDVPVRAYAVEAYENLVEEKLGDMMENINISGIVQEKINEMDVLEVEELLMSIMKKELNAIVNLGALIGFILGLINLLF
mgnify:CR=1 FL=1